MGLRESNRKRAYPLNYSLALYWLLGTSVRKIANFAFSSSLFAWHVKLDRGKSKDVLLALPEKKPQAYEKNRRLLGERA